MSDSDGSDDELGQPPRRVPLPHRCYMRDGDEDVWSLAAWWRQRSPSASSLQAPAPPPPPQPADSEEIRTLLLAGFRTRHFQHKPIDTILALAIRQALRAHQWTQKKQDMQQHNHVLAAQVQQLQQRLQSSDPTAAASASVSASAAPQAPSATGHKRPLETQDEEEKSAASESMLDVAPATSLFSSASAAAFAIYQSMPHSASSSTPVLESIAPSSGMQKKPRTDASLATAAPNSTSDAARRFSAPSISVSLMLQLLRLEEVACAMRVSRQWCAAALDPLVWSSRPTFMSIFLDVTRIDIGVRLITHRGGIAGDGHLESFTLPRFLQSYADSRLIRRLRAVSVESEAFKPEQIDLLRATFPAVTEIEAAAQSFAEGVLFTQGHLQRCVLTVDTTVLPKRIAADDPWPSFVRTIARCSALRQLVIRTHAHTRLSNSDLAVLLHSLPLLESLQVSSLWCTYGLTLTAPVNLRSLKLGLTVSQVERMCGAAAMLSNLCSLEIIIGYKDRDHDARERAAAQFKLAVESPLLTPSRLSCLARLPALLHLTCVLPNCAVDPLLPFRIAQQVDAAAFERLQSYTCVGEDPYQRDTFCGNSAREEISRSASAADLIPLRSLRSLHLSCCHSKLLQEERRLAALCAAIPNVQTLVLQCHSAEALSMSWCRSPAIQSLRRLSTLIVRQPEITKETFTAAMLVDLHALSQLPEIITFELVNVFRLNRLDLADLLTLRDPDDGSSEAERSLALC